MMENLLSTSSSMIETSSVTSQSERVFPTTDAEFDGETVLCRVCGDRASGFHYGVHACEGCKGFFRRSIQQKIQYRPCLKNQQCNIQRVNRNRCQYCRLKKCISVGMSRDAVRFGRVPKKEKARIIEQMQKKSLTSQTSELNSLLANDLDIVQAVVAAHHQTCDITQFRAHQMRDLALHKQEYINCPANMACPLNNEIALDASNNRNNLSDFSESFTPAIKSVVDFAKGIPGFVLLNQEDQVTLLKAGTFEVLLVRLACLFDPHSNTMMFTGGKLFKRQPSTMTTNAGFLLDSMFDFAERFNKMCLQDDEIALLSAVVLLSPDRPGLRNIEQVEKIQNKLTEALQNIVNTNHKEDSTLFAKLLMKTTDLRTLNTLHSEKSIAGQRSNQERRERQNTDDSDMDFQDSLSTRSSRSSPTLSETSNMTMTSGYSGETDGGGVVIGQRMPLDASGHQVVLRTPYGTFFREELSGFYGLMADQPRRRCNTLDRDTLTRPRLHTIEEGNRRRYTLDRDYINKMAHRLNDRLETRSNLKGDSLPPSMSNSATSSPIPEEGCGLYHVPSSASFAPITAPDNIMGHPSAIVTRTSPLAGTEAILTTPRTLSSPASPKSRSRSGSFTQDEYANARPRCYSFHLNSEGRAARMSLQRRMLVEQGNERDSQTSPDNNHYLSPEMRRGSVGAVYGLHNRKPSSLVDRSLAYMRGRYDVEKSIAADGRPVMKHIMPDGSVFGIKLTSDSTAQNPGLWHQQPMGMAPPISVPIMQRSREDLTRPIGSRSREWDVVNAQSRELPHEVLSRDLVKNALNGQRTSPQMVRIESLESQMVKNSKINSVKLDKTGTDRSAMAVPQQAHQHFASSAGSIEAAFAERRNSFHEIKSTAPISASDCSSVVMDTLSTTARSKASSPDMNSRSRTSSLRGSPVGDDFSNETFGHKKFDKFRKDKTQTDASSTTLSEDYMTGGKVREKTEAMRIKEEKMEEDNGEEDIDVKELKIDVSDMKAERKSPYGDNLSPPVSSSPTPSPNSDRPKLSAREAHPNLLAHLMNGGSSVRQGSPRLPSTPASVAIPPTNALVGFPWAMSPNLGSGSNSHVQAQLFRHPFIASQCSGFPGIMTSPSSSPSSTSSLTQATISHFTATVDQYNICANPSTQAGFCNQHNGNTDQKASNTKEDVHATAVSHLKDKILRKYDSMENLNKIGKDCSSLAAGAGSNSSPGMPSSGQWSKSNSQTILAALSSTADLNKELATKLTLSPSPLSSATITTSFPPSPPSTVAFCTQRLTCPFSSQIGSSVAAAASQAGQIPSHQSSGTSQLSHMLLSQDHHQNSLPMFHSMVSPQYQKLRNSSVAATNHTPASQSPLANMQHFAQMFVHGQMVAAADASDKRLDLSSPLNLTSKMEDGRLLPGSNSSSHNPQTPA